MAAIAPAHRGHGRSHSGGSAFSLDCSQGRRFTRPGHARAACTTVAICLLAFAAGCAGIGKRLPPPLPDEEQPAGTGGFTVAEGMLDTWNTIGKILVGLDGVSYEGRSQMLGLYNVRYRGVPFLVRAQALALDAQSPGLRTRVDALDARGKPFGGAEAAALLRILAERVPQEVAGYRQPVKLPDASSRKQGRKR